MADSTTTTAAAAASPAGTPATGARRTVSAGQLVSRLAAAGARVARQHAENAQREAVRDLQRLLMGLAICLVGAVFVLHAVIFLHALVVSLLVLIPGARLEWVLGGVLGVDLLVALLCLLVGGLMLRRPLMPQTRATFREIQDLLTSD